MTRPATPPTSQTNHLRLMASPSSFRARLPLPFTVISSEDKRAYQGSSQESHNVQDNDDGDRKAKDNTDNRQADEQRREQSHDDPCQDSRQHRSQEGMFDTSGSRAPD